MKDIFLYNPTGELALANGNNSYMPPKNLRQFERDLAFLPSFYAQEGDTILMDFQPDNEFLCLWQTLGLPSLNYSTFEEVSKTNFFDSFRPWSWNQVIHSKIKDLKPRASEFFKNSPNFSWDKAHKMFFSRATTNVVQEEIKKIAINNHTINIPQPAINLYSTEELTNWLKNKPNAILKMPWSSSGRGIHRVDKNNNRPINMEWIEGALKQQGFITAEPLLDKRFDFSFQFNLDRTGNITFIGISYFINDEKGHFIGGNLNWPHTKDEISDFLSNETITQSAQLLIHALKTVNPQQYYEGHFGVDAIIYLDDNNNFKIHPCLDINWRFNMGLININLNKYVDPNSIGKWEVRAFKSQKWNLFIEENSINKPLIIQNNKIKSGFLNMTPPNNDSLFGVFMVISEKQ